MLISIDNGGTLTDACVLHGAKVFHAKTLTTPHDLTQCFIQVLTEVSKRIYGEPNLATLLEELDYIRYSTTQGTNAVVQRRGPQLGLIIGAGQNLDALLRNEDEHQLFKAMVGDRVGKVNLAQSDGDLEAEVIGAINELTSRGASRLVVSLGGERLLANENRVKRIALLRYPRHLLGAVPILFSHQLSDDRDDARRTWSSLLNAFLHQGMERFLHNAEGVLRQNRARHPLLIFCNDGTSSRVAKTSALKTWGSGPRGGLEGAKALALHYGRNAVITVDIGGTTTDIGVVEGGSVRERRSGMLENVEISLPLCEVESLGVGGSSVFRVRDGALTVGPDSVGGAPGPACFGYGGKEATITDACLLLGILNGDSYFGGGLKLDPERAKAVIKANIAEPLGVSLDEALIKMHEAYVAKIAAAISPLMGNAGETSLLAFGGAGPLAACLIAETLGISEIIVPRMAAVFSAFGIGFSDIAHNYDMAVSDTSEGAVAAAFEQILQKTHRDMFAEGFAVDECVIEKSVSFTAGGQYVTQRLQGEAKPSAEARQASDLRIRLRATKAIPHFTLLPANGQLPADAKLTGTRTVRGLIKSGNLPAQDLRLFRLEDLAPGDRADGPAIVEEEYFTCLVLEGWGFMVNENHDLILRKH
jgi:N-methylhydantoinase A